jgi:hypothetical protein
VQRSALTVVPRVSWPDLEIPGGEVARTVQANVDQGVVEIQFNLPLLHLFSLTAPPPIALLALYTSAVAPSSLIAKGNCARFSFDIRRQNVRLRQAPIPTTLDANGS